MREKYDKHSLTNLRVLGTKYSSDTEFTANVKFVFNRGTSTKTERAYNHLRGQSVTYKIEFIHAESVSALPLTLTIYGETKSHTLAHEIIQFKEAKDLFLGTSSSLEITLGAGFIHLNGWTTFLLPGYEKPYMTPNLAYNTMISFKPVFDRYKEYKSGFSVEEG